ncbi:MAG: Asp-tRNA(Asn)/Glu-tRNA(Gln) amidotransferase subunit GatB [Eubacterium sp.]|nr:Asp-tRNA(Asn)/Glu-tRNA(Gln) amidotransferase subunit GatB [Eubacterium sp.]
MEFETVCGLEVHTELLTKTKVFCSCEAAFGGEPNTRCCEVCCGMPGALPTVNARVVELAVRCGLALNCEITRYNKFDRKNYFYPDLPKAYQISQLYLPICKNGFVEINDSVNGKKKKIRIHEIHIEEDAGKLIHQNGKSLVNYNRAGVPLLEIVSEPDLSNGTEAAEYTKKLREILLLCGISDCKMQEGSLRADVNVSVREKGSAALGKRTEMKNLSSFAAIKAAVDNEAKRQLSVIGNGGSVIQETRRFDEKTQASLPMRSKEEAMDYKYFPEPDIPPLVISGEFIGSVKASMPELPDEKRARYVSLGLTPYDAELICSDLKLIALFEKTLEITDAPKETANWLLGEVTVLLKCGEVEAEKLGEIINLLLDGKITRDSAKRTLEACVKEGAEPLAFIKENALEIVNDLSLVGDIAERIISENPKAVSEYKEGKEKALNFLVGQCMRELRGKATADSVRKAILEII